MSFLNFINKANQEVISASNDYLFDRKYSNNLEETESQIPINIYKYAKFKGLIWDSLEKIYVKPYSSEIFTLEELQLIVNNLKSIL